IVQKGIARHATGILYDRAGTGFSARVRLPRTAGQVVDELRELMKAVELPGPYILVGHSLGGLYARRYAQLFPGEVTGLVLLDPRHEALNAQMPRQPNDKRGADEAEREDEKNKSLLSPLVAAILGRAAANRLTRSLISVLPPIPRYRALYRKLFAAEY